jgi:hypothetical protein
MRGFTEFAAVGRSLRRDFYVPGEKLVIEYDERQHFTLPRARALELYPPDLRLGFDRQEWIAACQSIRATDVIPPYRDEQRAFYDSLRDILAARNGVRLIRLRAGSFDRTSGDGERRLADFIPSKPASSPPAAAGAAGHAVGSTAAVTIGKLALVSHDYTVPSSRDFYDYSDHFHRINRVCDEHGCDTVLYALYTLDRHSIVRNHDAIFGGLAHVRTVIAEVGEPGYDRFDHVEVWQRGRLTPIVAKQRFATSTAPDAEKRSFLADLDQRRIGDSLLVICGETNIASLVRATGGFSDPYGFADRLGGMNVGLVLNQIHDYMRRYEMREKRRYYSLGGRTVVSVWNRGKGKEAYLPWTVFHHGQELTEAVEELPTPFHDRPDIRIGVLDRGPLAS